MKNCVVAASIAALKWYLSQRINKDSRRRFTCCMILPQLVGVDVCLCMQQTHEKDDGISDMTIACKRRVGVEDS